MDSATITGAANRVSHTAGTAQPPSAMRAGSGGTSSPSANACRAAYAADGPSSPSARFACTPSAKVSTRRAWPR